LLLFLYPEIWINVLSRRVLIISLFLPWVNIFIGKFSPIDALEMSKKIGKNDSGLALAVMCLFIPSISGITTIISILNPNEATKKILQICSIAAISATLLVVIFLSKEMGKNVDVFKLLTIGWYVSLIGSVVISIGTYKKYFETTAPIQRLDTSYQTNTIEGNQSKPPIFVENTNQMQPPVVAQPQYIMVVNEPSKPFSERIAPLIEWLSQHRKKMFISGIVFGALAMVYVLFIKINPEKEGKNAAIEKCNCWDADRTLLITNLDIILSALNNSNYKRRSEVRTEIDKYNKVSDAYIKCEETTSTKARNKMANDYEKIGRFNAAYSAHQCETAKDQIVSTKLNEIEQKINLIKDPEPDVDKIKTDLIGTQLPGVSLELLSDIKDFKISNITKTSDRIEYQVDMKLIAKNSDFDHDCQAVVIYTQNENGWNFNSVKTQFITFTNTFYTDRATTITTLNNCNWTAENHYKLGWKTYNWEYAPEVTTGPELGQKSLPSSNVYYIRSLENKNVDVKFTYKPNY
jgi:hypothetical protein